MSLCASALSWSVTTFWMLSTVPKWMMTFEGEFELQEKEEVTRTQIRWVRGLQNHWNTLFGQKFLHRDGSVMEHCCDAASKCPQSLAGHDEPLFWVIQRTLRYYCWLTVCLWGTNSLWTTSWLSKKQISIDLIFDLLILALFRCSELLTCHSELRCLVLGSYLKIHDSSPVMTYSKKFSSFSMHSRMSRHTFLWFSFCLLVRFFGTSFAQIFCMPNSWVKMTWMIQWFKFNSLLIILTVKNWSDLPRSLTLFTFLSFFDMQDLPEWGLSSTLSRPSKNAVYHLKTCALDRACSP